MRVTGHSSPGVLRPLASCLLLSLVVLGVLWLSVIPRLIERALPELIEDRCQTCRVDLDRVRLRLLPLRMILFNFHVIEGDPRETEIDATVEQITVQLSIARLLSGKLHVHALEIRAPSVVVTEGDLRHPATVSGTQKSTIWNTLTVQSTVLSDGYFAYVRVQAGQSARLHVQRIQAKINRWGLTGEFVTFATRGIASGTLVDSGRFFLSVTAPLRSKTLLADVSLTIDQLDLSRLNPFFEAYDGVRFKGSLIRGRSSIALRGSRLSGWVQASYHGLGIHLTKTRDRSGLAAVMMNLAKSTQLDTGNTAELPRNQLKTVRLGRTAQETLLQLIFRGMKVAAMDIVMS